MASFDYVALDLAGRTRSGHLTAADETAAREVLERRRLAAIRLSPGKAKAGSAGLFGGRLDARSLALVTRQLATLVAVAPLEEALRTIALHPHHPPAPHAPLGLP
mgnify:CR=1 FL=1